MTVIRNGQISIDYLAGAMIFFGSMVFLLSNVMADLPVFSQAQETDELTLSAWSMSEVVMNDRGHWENATHSGEDWPDHPGKLAVLGVAGEDGLSGEKIDALTDLNQSWIRSGLHTNKKVNIEFREVAEVDTHRSFEQGSSPGFITEPPYGDDTADTVHFGAEELGGEERFFLLMKNTSVGWYSNLSVSTDWDFSSPDTEFHNLNQTQYLPIGARTYVAEAGNTEISNGNLLILWRGRGRTGDVPGEEIEDIVSIKRYGVLNGNIVEVTFRVWE